MLTEITPRKLADRLAAGERLHLLDVRQPAEHAVAALPNSVLIPLNELVGRLGEVPTDAPLVVYCHHGVRSLHAAAYLAQRGLTVASLAGGIDAWSLLIDPTVARY